MTSTNNQTVTLNDPGNLPLLMTTDETAHILRLAPKTLRNWRTTGQGPRARKIGGRTVYPRADVLAFAGVAA